MKPAAGDAKISEYLWIRRLFSQSASGRRVFFYVFGLTYCCKNLSATLSSYVA